MKTGETFLEHLPPDQLVPIETVEHFTGLNRRTVNRMANGQHPAGKLPYVDFGRHEKRFRVRDVLEFIESRRRE